MKKSLLILLTAISMLGLANEAGANDLGGDALAPAPAPAFDFIGRFTAPVEMMMLGYESDKACERDGGRWVESDCVFTTDNSVEITRQGNGLHLNIETVGDTGHSCEYAGPAWHKDVSTLISMAQTTEWSGITFVPALCEVQVVSENDGSVSVRTNGKCSSFCGARAALEFSAAKR